MSVIGIDPSFTGTGVILLYDAEPPAQLLIKTLAQDTIFYRVKSIISAIDQSLDQSALDIVSIEGFSYGSAQYAHQMGYLGYKIREYFARYWKGVPVIEPSPTQVKKFATGKGKGDKDIIIKEVYKRWGYDTNNNNLADAYVLARIGEAYLQNNYKPDDLHLFQFEVISALKGDKSKKKSKKKVAE